MKNIVHKIIEIYLHDTHSYEEFLQWEEQIALFMINYTKGNYLSVFDPGTATVSESALSSYLPYEFIFNYQGNDCFFAYGIDELSKDDMTGLLGEAGFTQDLCSIIPSLLSDIKKIELINNWKGDRICSHIEMFMKDEDSTLKWYNPPCLNAQKLLSESISIGSNKHEINTRQVLESIAGKCNDEKYLQWRKGVLSFIYDYIKEKPITLIEPGKKRGAIDSYTPTIERIKRSGKKMLSGYIERGINISLLSDLLNDAAFASGKIAIIPSLLNEHQRTMLFVYWDIDKVYNGIEMFMMGHEGKSFKWYNPEIENSSELFNSYFDNVPD
ncbi:MAG: hypothetical protein LBK45_01065 [Tannerellaceae bacterium]|jgi:hypothetical protein|nr:hypothetical protein [Tannerellaceae bacterium]